MNHSSRWFWALAAIILLTAVTFRFAQLGLKPAHHDECVNYAFTKKLVEKSVYHYNPTAYHGPFLYFAGLPAALIGGYSKTALRFTPALFGVLTVLLLLLMRPILGEIGALFAAAALAINPASVYFDRTFIHEVYFAFATVAMLWAFFRASRRGGPWLIVAFYVAWVVGFANKETTAFNVLVMAPAIVTAWLASTYGGTKEPLAVGRLFGSESFHPVIWGVGIAVSLWVLLFTSFLSHPQGAVDFFRAYMPWFETGVKKATHVKVWYYFGELLVTYYWPALPLAAWALVRGVWKRKPTTLVLAIVAVGLLGLYSAIPYKTPWCVLTIGIAVILLAADGLNDLWRLLPRNWLRAVLAGAALAALVVQGAYSYKVNFHEYDYNHNDQSRPRQHEIVYVQTVREYEDLIDDLDRIAAADGRGKKLPIHLSAGSKNPGRLYLHDYRKVKVGRNPNKKPVNSAVVIVRNKEKKKYAEQYKAEYHEFGTYPVFPGWHVNLMVREDLWQKTQAAGIESQASPSS
ncbi:MAG: TIGR03663 family protein [Candidatus Lernaella stagnicola]|nr:TIGR03663 family protein [Candidatus Lernaella stagnicola]